MAASKVRSKLLIGIIVALFFGIALYVRTYLPYDRVFTGDWIKFTGVDAYYHARLVDNLVRNFPHLFNFDPYLVYPAGGGIGNIRFFDWLLASVIWVIGLGSPTEHTVDVVSVYFPAVLGALTIIPVYFIGRELFGRWAGVFAAGLIAVLPGEFLGRSILGFTDHHVAEALFSTTAILFLVLAIKTAIQRQLTFSHLKHRDWAMCLRPIIYSLLAGIFLGIYVFTFLGALLFIFIIFTYFVVQFILDHLRSKSTDYLSLIGVILFSVTLVASLLISAGKLYLVSLIIALLTLPVLSSISRLMANKKIKPAYYPLTLIGLGLAALGLFYLINPSLINSMLSQFDIFRPTGATLTTIEAQPLLFPRGDFTWDIAWGNFNTSFFLSFISLGILIYLVIKQGSAEKSLLVVWSLVILAVTLGQRRFAYYLAVNIALLTGYLSWQALSLVGFKELIAKTVETPRNAARGKANQKKSRLDINLSRVVAVLEVLIVFFVVFFWNIQPTIDTASAARFAPSDAWLSSLSWMKENTPEPFGNPDLYYQLEGTHNYRSLDWLKRNVSNSSGDPDFYSQLAEIHKYPESAYGVVSWWDYGYWISRVAHRIPVANPSQDPVALTKVASFFTSQDEKSAIEIMGALEASYIIIDHETATSKFWAITVWADRSQTEFFDYFYQPQQGQMQPYIFPEYYRSLSTRLYNFDGKAVTPESTLVISYQERANQAGMPYKEVTSEKEFTNYEEAEAYLLNQDSTANYRIVGTNPFISPVPLEALENYTLAHSSAQTLTVPGGAAVPTVKIFEYLD